MAISYIHARALSRSEGRKALKFAAYIANDKLYDEVHGATYDYTNKKDCVYQNILLPDTAFVDGLNIDNHPFNNRENLWNAVENIENSHNRRASAQLAMVFEVALPKELSLEQNKKLINEFIKENYVDKYNLVADIAIHDKEDENIHAHVMLGFRQLHGLEFSNMKVRNATTVVLKSNGIAFANDDGLSKKYTAFQNAFFKRNNIDLVVDQDRIVPLKHMRRSRMDGTFLAEDVEHNAKAEKENVDRVSNDHRLIIATLASRQTTFTQADIESLVYKCTLTDTSKYDEVLNKVLESKELINLGYSTAGRVTYTTQENYDNDIDLARSVNTLEGKTSFAVKDKVINKVAIEKGLFQEQVDAVRYLAQSGDITCLVGFAGTGKTYTMGALNDVFVKSGYKIYGTSVSGKAVQGLANEASIESKTIANILFNYRKGFDHNLPDKKSVLVVDEASMVSLDDMLDLIKMTKERQLKLVLAGDPRQLEAIGRGNPFKAILERLGFYEMSDVQRQVEILDQIATRNLGKGETGKAIDYYHDKGSIHIQDFEENTQGIIDRYASLLDEGYYNEKLKADVKYQVKDTLMLAYTRADVEILNSKAREILLSKGLIKDCVDLNISGKTRSFGIGERILFEHGQKLDGDRVENGIFADIKSINGSVITVITDENTPREIKVDTKEYDKLGYGYSVTVHKSQGMSVQNVLGYITSRNWFSHLAYVVMSRHKRNMELYVDNAAYKDLDSLRRGLSSKTGKESNVLDFVQEKESNRLVSKFRTILGLDNVTFKLKNRDLDTNAKFVIVAELADISREVNRDYFKLLDESDTRELSDDSRAVVEKKYKYRNELAYKVASNYDEFAKAIYQNDLDIAKIDKWSDDYLAESNFEKFVNSKDVIYKGSIAESISKTARGRMLLSEQSLWQDYSKCLGEYKLDKLIKDNAVTKSDIDLVEQYLGYRDEAYSYYQKTQQEYFDDKDIELFKDTVFAKNIKQSELDIKKYQDLSNATSKKGDILAYKISKALDSYKPIIEAKYTGKMLDSVYEAIARQARYQEAREDVDKYIHAKGATREQFAYRIYSNGKEYARFVAEAGVDWKDINNDSRRIALEVFRSNLDEGVRPIFDSMQKYKDTQYEVAKIMSELSKEVSDKKQYLFKTIAKRNKLAYDLLNLELSGKRDQELLDKLHPTFNLETVEKHEALHIERLESEARVEQYSKLLRDKDKNLEQLKDIATTMTGRWGKHVFYLKRKNLNINEIFSYADQRRYDLENAKFTGIDKEIHRSIADYIIAKNKSSTAWADIRLGRGDKGQAQELGNIRNLRAYHVSRLIGNNPTSAMYSMFNEKTLKLRDLVKSASEHELAIKLNDYTKLNPNSEEAIKFAKEISVKYPQKGFIYYGLERFGIDKKRFYTNVKIFDKNNLEFKQAKAHLDLYKEASDKGVTEWQGRLASEILANRGNLKYLGDIDYNTINIQSLEYRLANYKAGKEARVVEKLDFNKINTEFKKKLDNYGYIFGSKTKETAKNISFGNYNVSKKSGKWFDENQNAYRDPTEAMLKIHGTKHKYTGENYAVYVGRVAGLSDSELRIKEIIDPVKNQLQNELADFKERIEKKKAVQALWDNSQPLAGTIADRYLKEHRGIEDTSNLAMRYIPKGTDITLSSGKVKPSHAPMLLIGGYDFKGEIVSAQRVYLDESTANKNTQMDNPKLSMGLISGSGGLVQKGTSNRVYIVEGPETGASIALADREASVYCSFGLGNLSKLDKLIKANNYKEVILAADNDGVGSNAEKLTKEASDKLKKQGIDLKVIEPKAIDGLDKTDWNDVLKYKGLNKVQKQLGIEVKEKEQSKEYIKAKELLDKLSDVHAKVEKFKNLAKSVNQPIIYDRLSDSAKNTARAAKATLPTYEKQREKLFNKFEEKRHLMPKKIRKSEQFKEVNEIYQSQQKQLNKSKSKDYSLEI